MTEECVNGVEIVAGFFSKVVSCMAELDRRLTEILFERTSTI